MRNHHFLAVATMIASVVVVPRAEADEPAPSDWLAYELDAVVVRLPDTINMAAGNQLRMVSVDRRALTATGVGARWEAFDGRWYVGPELDAMSVIRGPRLAVGTPGVGIDTSTTIPSSGAVMQAQLGFGIRQRIGRLMLGGDVGPGVRFLTLGAAGLPLPTIDTPSGTASFVFHATARAEVWLDRRVTISLDAALDLAELGAVMFGVGLVVHPGRG